MTDQQEPDDAHEANPPAGGFDIGGLLSQAQEMSSELMAGRAGAAAEEIVGSAGGGAVRLIADGTGRFQRCDIDTTVIDPSEPDMLGDLVVAAANDAMRQINEAAQSGVQDQLGELLGGLGLGDGAGGLGNLMENLGLGGRDESSD